jgi:hypothetical protein
MPTEPEDQVTWLRHRVVRLRTILRFAREPRAEAGLRELIADVEARLDALGARRSADERRGNDAAPAIRSTAKSAATVRPPRQR